MSVRINSTLPALPRREAPFGYEEAHRAADSIFEHIDQNGFRKPLISVMLGSIGDGLIEDATHPDQRLIIEWGAIPHMPVPSDSVHGHAGELIIAPLKKNEDITVAFWSGRPHSYQALERVLYDKDLSEVVGFKPIDRGSDLQQSAATFPIAITRALGVLDSMTVSSVGSVNAQLPVGTFGLIRDQINRTNKKGGPVDSRWYHHRADDPDYIFGKGDRFADNSNLHNEALRELIWHAAHSVGIKLEEGIYSFEAGPQYESPAECRMIRMIGGDLAGMSAANEANRARNVGFNSTGGPRHTGLFNVTNLSQDQHSGALEHGHVSKNSGEDKNRERFARFMTAALEAIHQDQEAA